jgi:putative transposase
MANTYTQIHIQAVFAVKNRDCVIRNYWKDDLYKYITGIIQNHNHKVLAINGMPDHIHILFGMRPTQSLSDLMQDIKGDSSKWINQNGFVAGKFSWQEGYGAFSYSKSHVINVINYINNQEKHHKKITFIEEYNDFLEKFEVDHDDRYIFEAIKYDLE